MNIFKKKVVEMNQRLFLYFQISDNLHPTSELITIHIIFERTFFRNS